MFSLSKTFRHLILLCSIVLLAGCAATQQNNNPSQIDSQWLNPSATFEQKTITGVLVGLVTDNPTTRRIFEDAVSQVLTFHGVPAEPSYLYITNSSELLLPSGAPAVSRLRVAANKAKANDVMLVRTLGSEQHIQYNPGMTWGPMWGPGPYWGGPGPFWGGPFGPDVWAIPPSITQNTLAKASVELISAKGGNVLWSASTTTLLGQMPQARMFQEYGYMIYQTLLANGFLIPQSAPVVAPNLR